MSLLYIYPNQNNALLTWRRESLGGKDYIVAQGVPLVEGVLNGRFVSAEEFGAFVNDWNDVPIVMRHPKENGGSARVRNPDVPIVGRFYGAQMDGKRLTGEYWLEADKLDNPDGEIILSHLSTQKPSETSTGYWAESIPSVGNWNGRDFAFVDQNIHPDHIALLPDEIGACSLQDGCGMNRNSKDGDMNQNAVTKTEGSESYPASHYLVVEDPEKPSTWHLRVMDKDGNPDHRLMGAAWAALHGGYRGQKYEGPNKQEAIAKLKGMYEKEKLPLPGEQQNAAEIVEALLSNRDIFRNVTGLTGRAAKLWEDVYQSYIDKKMAPEDAAKRAWAAIKQGWEKNDKGDWVRKNQLNSDMAPEEAEGLAALVAFYVNN